MKASELMSELFALAESGDYTKSCDTCKAGDPAAEISKVAVSMFATPDVIKSAKEWGAELLIVHEPTYYNHFDVHSDEKLETEKRRLIEASGLTIFRCHDHPHRMVPDMIAAGELKYLGLELDGEIENTDYFDLVRIRLKNAVTPREFAKLIEERLGIAHIRIAGAADAEMSRVSCMFGSPGGIVEELKRDQSEMVLTGETSEWAVAEYVRDASQLGYKKALLVLGHAGSERDGMRLLADIVTESHPELETRYFECGEVYTYTDGKQ